MFGSIGSGKKTGDEEDRLIDSPTKNLWNFNDIWNFDSKSAKRPPSEPEQDKGVKNWKELLCDVSPPASLAYASPIPTNDSNDFGHYYAEWNTPRTRSPIYSPAQSIPARDDTAYMSSLNSRGSMDFTPPDVLPQVNQADHSLRSYVSCTCEICNLMKDFDRQFEYDYNNNYESIRRQIQNNSREAEYNIPFTPKTDNCSTPFVTRKPLSEINNNLPYFTPQFPEIEENRENWNLNTVTSHDVNWQRAVGVPIPAVRNNRKKQKEPAVDYCVFCFNNQESPVVYSSHTVKDAKGRTLCPKLRVYVCPICKKDGDEAHTLKYCKERKPITPEDLKRREEEAKRREIKKETRSSAFMRSIAF